MAIDMCPDCPILGTSPRISFSSDLRQSEENNSGCWTPNFPLRSDAFLLDSNSDSDFNFCLGDSTVTEACSADELFSGGLILPLQIQPKQGSSLPKQKNAANIAPSPPLPISTSLDFAPRTNYEDEPKSQSKSFWRIKRSTSLHCDNSSYKKGSFWSLPLLDRSNSTGSASNLKPSLKDVNTHKHNSQKSSSSAAGVNGNGYSFCQKPPLKKNSRGSNYGNGVRFSPVLLNVPTANLFGLGSLFRNGKDKKNKK